MKKTMLLTLILAIFVVAVSPAMAQVEGQSASRSQGAPVPPSYVVEDGVVTLDGDLQVDCLLFAQGLDEGFDQGLSQSQQQNVLNQCEAQGALGGGSDTTSLPDTGGPALLTVFAAGLVVAGFGSLLLKRRT